MAKDPVLEISSRVVVNLYSVGPSDRGNPGHEDESLHWSDNCAGQTSLYNDYQVP